MDESIKHHLESLTEQMQTLQQRMEQEAHPEGTEWLSQEERQVHQYFLQRVERALAAQEAWYDYLGDKYHLHPGDEITPAGQILRRR